MHATGGETTLATKEIAMNPQPTQTNSPLFAQGAVGVTYDCGAQPTGDVRSDAAKFDYEGNWLFCVFDGPELFAARLGFGRGGIDTTDFGGPSSVDPQRLFFHLELLTDQGAVVFVDQDHRASHIVQGAGPMDVTLDSGGRRLISISGWPNMTWHFQSPDAEAEIQMSVVAERGVVLPDLLMKHNRFAMWVNICKARGQARFGQRIMKFQGTAFFDHPRINLETIDTTHLRTLFYTPMTLSDGSRLLTYRTTDTQGRDRADYCFAWLLEPDGRGHWMTMRSFEMPPVDAEGKPVSWHGVWTGASMTIDVTGRVHGTNILRSWGRKDAPQTREANDNLPLWFTAEVQVTGAAATRTLTGRGVAEYIDTKIGMV